jgi:hypothetical protein
MRVVLLSAYLLLISNAIHAQTNAYSVLNNPNGLLICKPNENILMEKTDIKIQFRLKTVFYYLLETNITYFMQLQLTLSH